MGEKKKLGIKEHFQGLTDPRRGECLHPLVNIVTIAVCGVVCGADDFVAIARFGEAKKEWLGKLLDLSNGMPLHDRFNAVLSAIKPAEFERCMLSWTASLHEETGGKIIALDGKTLRRSFDKASGKAALHMVSAWATDNHMLLGQTGVDEKSNEITAIPKLLEMLEISGALVTIDAMGCQTEIAAQIVDQGADYCLAVKSNQPTLHDGIVSHFQKHIEDDFAGTKVRRHSSDEKGHGRVERRDYFICPAPMDLPDRERWKHIKAIGMVVSSTERGGKDCVEVRYYILSVYLSGRRFSEAVRGHWSIENNLHLQLDVTFGEDSSRLRQGHAAENFSSLRRFALTLLKRESTLKVGVKNKRLSAAWDDSYLEKLLVG